MHVRSPTAKCDPLPASATTYLVTLNYAGVSSVSDAEDISAFQPCNVDGFGLHCWQLRFEASVSIRHLGSVERGVRRLFLFCSYLLWRLLRQASRLEQQNMQL